MLESIILSKIAEVEPHAMYFIWKQQLKMIKSAAIILLYTNFSSHEVAFGVASALVPSRTCFSIVRQE